jgi:hypothetical protein
MGEPRLRPGLFRVLWAFFEGVLGKLVFRCGFFVDRMW